VKLKDKTTSRSQRDFIVRMHQGLMTNMNIKEIYWALWVWEWAELDVFFYRDLIV
jgi:hypothetical protein